MKNRPKILQNEEKLPKFSQNGSEIHQIALKHRKNKVSQSEIRFETDLRRKNHPKPPKSPEKCPLSFGHSVERDRAPSEDHPFSP